MAQAILLRGGAGGVTSDDVTASKDQVLQGYKTITVDSDDEVVEGNFPVFNDTDSRQEFWYYNEHGKDAYVTRIPEAAYRRYYNHDGSQGWDPWVRISRQLIKNSINYHPELTIDTVTTCGERGQIPDRGDGQVVSYLQGREDWANRIWVLFKNGWYHRAPWDDGQGHIHEAYVYVTYEQLKNLFGIDGSKMLQDYSIAGVPGAIPKWVCTTGDVITALGGEGFVWDDTHASRGRGIVVKIPNGRYIQGANWVFLPSPNHLPHNIVKDININGVTGTRDWADRTNEYAINSNVSVSQQQNNQPIALGNAFSGSETLFIGVDLVGVDVDGGLVRRDKGNGRRNIGRILLGKNDSNFVATFIRRCPVQIELSRDWAGNMSFILHIPDGWNFGQTQFYVYIYGHSSMQNNF